MPIPIRLPALSPDFAAGTIAGWRKAVGDPVEKGDILLEVESDKAVIGIEAEDCGVLGAIQVLAGTQDVPVNTILGFLFKDGEADAQIPEDTAAATPSQPFTAPPSPGAVQQGPQSAPPASPGRLFASPAARRVALERGVDLSKLSGRGPDRRILKVDVEEAAPEASIHTAFDAGRRPEPKRHAPLAIPNSNFRKVLAQRLAAAKRDIPHFYLTIDCDIDALLNVRQQLNEHYASAGVKISVNDWVIKAAARALVDVPAANASWSEEAIRQYGTVDVAMAVATEEGVITPIIRDADIKSLVDICKESKVLAARAIAGTLTPHEFKGGGFSISNLGMYGIKQFSAIVNPPQSCILAVGAAEKRPIVRGDVVTVATLMTCTLSVDHRSVDGAVGAKFLSAFRRYIERPTLLVLNHESP